MKLVLTAEIGAGGNDFLATVIEAVNSEHGNVYIQVAGEYGHLHVESIEELEDQ